MVLAISFKSGLMVTVAVLQRVVYIFAGSGAMNNNPINKPFHLSLKN
jgi:hypothetical protein